MNYIDVRVRVPTTKLGQLVQGLPHWAKLIGLDKMEGPREVRHQASNGEYKPEPGSVVEKVLKRITKTPMRPSHIMGALKAEPQAVASAIAALRNRGMIVKQKDGAYVSKK